MTDDIDTPASRVRDRELTDEEIEKIANYTKPSWAQRDFHSRSVVLVKDTDDGIEISGPHTIEGGTHPNWSDDVLFTFGAAPKSAEGVRKSYSMAKAQFLSHT